MYEIWVINSNYLKGTVASKATNDNTDIHRHCGGIRIQFTPNPKKNAEKNNDTSRILCCYSAIPNFQQIDVASATGPHGFCWSRCWSRWLPSFPSKLGATGSPQNREPWEERLASAERVEQREPKMLDLRDLDSFGIGFQTSLDVLESIGVYRFLIICQVSEPLWTCLNHELWKKHVQHRLCNLVFTAHATHAVSWLPLSRTAVRRTPMIKFLIWL